MISKQFNPHDIKVGDLMTGYHKGFHQVTCIKERWYSKDSPGGAEKKSNSFSKEGSPLVYYKKMYNDDGTPAKAKKENCCDIQFCTPAKISIEQNIKKLQETIINLKLI